MTVKRALISVSDKNGLAEFAAGLRKLGIDWDRFRERSDHVARRGVTR